MDKDDFLQRINEELIVSCQALEDEPLHGSKHMAKMSLAAQIGGAAAIRANGIEDIIEIKKTVDLPIIGLIKRDYPDSPVFITPTLKEIKELIDVEVDVIAIDATKQRRPNDEKLEDLVNYIKDNSNCIIMADISTFEEAIEAFHLGVDIVATTLSGYTSYTENRPKPDIPLVKKIAEEIQIPIIAEGNIETPKEAVEAMKAGASSVVVGSAITRPQILTQKFVSAIKKEYSN